MATGMARPARRASAGFTYLGVLLAVALVGASLGVIGEVWRTAQLREAERDLRFIGNEIRRAIGRYYNGTPGPVKKFPRSLDDLIQDNRYPGTRRYLRKLYRDPITLSREWGLLPAPDGGIAGVYSLSADEPIGRFLPADSGLEAGADVSYLTPAGDRPGTKNGDEAKKPSYADWKFEFQAPAPARPPGRPGRPADAAAPQNGLPR